MTHAVFDRVSGPCPSRFLGGGLDSRDVFRVNLCECGGAFQFFDGVAEHALVRSAVVQAIPLGVDDGDHIGGVFADQAEDLFAFNEPTPNAMYLQLLVDRIQVEKQYDAEQARDLLAQSERGAGAGLSGGLQHRKEKRSDAPCQEQRNGDGRRPEQPFPSLDFS